MDRWGGDNDIYDIYDNNDKIYDLTNVWNTNYFNKINIILDNNDFDLYLDFNTFIKKYDIDNNLKEFLIRNIIYFNFKFKIQLDLSCLSMYSICLSNSLIDDYNDNNEYKYYLDKYLDNHTISPYPNKEIELIYLNIIYSNKIELFIYLNDKYPVINLINKINTKLLNYNNFVSLDYNIINHSLLCSNLITEYILNNYKFNFLNLLYNHIKLSLNIHNLQNNINLITKIVVTELNDTIFPIELFFKWSCENKIYNTLIENIVFVSNKNTINNLYIVNCIKSLNYTLLDTFLKKQSLILSSLNFITIFHELIEIFNNKLKHKDYNETYILKIWNLLFPYVEKYLDFYSIKTLLINNGHDESGLNNIVSLRKSYIILPQIEQYIDDWNISDFYDFTPILDAIRYSSINTVKYILDPKYNINLLHHSYDNNNILSCALYNSDIRVIKCVHELIKNDDILQNFINSFDKIYLDIFKSIQNPVFKKFRIKFDILIDISGSNLIDYFVYKFMQYESFMKHVIQKYTYKLTFSKYDETYTTQNKKCSKKTLEYLKLIVDNTDFNSKDFNYRNFINFIVKYGCINMGIEILDYSKTKYNLNKIKLDNYQPYITFLTSITLNVYLMHNNCKCITYNEFSIEESKDNKDKLFEKYIVYLFKNIIVKEESILYSTFFTDSDGYNYNSIAPILFKYGIYPDTISLEHNPVLLNLYNFQLIRQIELKKRHNINKTLINWRIVICVLKLFVRKRFNTSRKNHSEKLLLINNEINLKSCLQNYKSDSKLVSHIKPIDCNNINNTHLQLTLKADGIYKKGVFNIFPKLNNINLNLIEYEIIKSTNICYLFNYLDDSIDNYSFIIKLRKSHDYIPNKIFPPLNLNNYEQILFEYEVSESAAINKFVKEHPYKKKWWAKYIFKLDLMSKFDYNILLQNISKLKFNCISNDGWILIDSNYTNILKIKPKNNMTIDLLYINTHLYDAQKNYYQFKSNIELINNTIYRCYYNEQTNVWNPIDIRTDKIKPNNVSICEYIEKYHSYLWNFNDINKLSPYYHKYSIRQNYNRDITNRIKGYVLDLGCGFKQLKFNYVGIDIDPKLLDKKKNNIYISDLSKPWHINYQSNIMNYFPNINDFNTKYNNTKFDTILIINSIHYLLGENNDELFKNINKYSHKNSIIIIKFLDMELLKTLFIDTNIINYNASFVKKNGDYIKLFYNWCHEIPIIEKLYSKNHIELLVNKYGWQIDSYNYNNLDNYSYLSKWELYLKCFSTLVIRRT